MLGISNSLFDILLPPPPPSVRHWLGVTHRKINTVCFGHHCQLQTWLSLDEQQAPRALLLHDPKINVTLYVHTLLTQTIKTCLPSSKELNIFNLHNCFFNIIELNNPTTALKRFPPVVALFSTHRKSQLASSLRELLSNHNIWKHSLRACELPFAMSGKEA